MAVFDGYVVEFALSKLNLVEDRVEGASLMRSAVDTASRELSPEAFSLLEASIFRRVFDMVNSVDIQEKRGAVVCLDALIEASSCGGETKIIKLANSFKGLLSANTDADLLHDVARALGHLARVSPSNNDFVEFEVLL